MSENQPESAPRATPPPPGAGRPRPVATISVDLDPVDVHLRGYGHFGIPPDPLVHDRALGRLLELFSRHSVPATFFVLAREVRAETSRAHIIRDAGHEIASHGIDHPASMAALPYEVVRIELEESRRRLEAVTGRRVVGFRAPDWSVGRRVAAALAETGYRYDASLMPTPALLAGRLLLAVRARRPGDVVALRPPPTLRRRPYRWLTASGSIVEFPMAVSPRLLIPLYHTIRPLLGDEAFQRHLDGFVEREEAFSYALHGVDALGLHEDGVDPRLRDHPGMRTSLDAKLGLLDRTVEAIAARFTVRTFAERIGDGP